MDRRKSHRVATSSPIRFEWLTPERGLVSTRGMTRDVSSGGVYGYIEHPLAMGLELEFDVQNEIVVEAIVRRLEEGSGMGVEFVVLTEDDDRRLREFLGRNKVPTE